MGWMEILKLKQINISSTKLRDKEIPEDEDEEDCLNRLIALKNKIYNYEFNLNMPPWFSKIIDWGEEMYHPNRYFQIEGNEKWNEALLPELLKINPEWEERINTRNSSGYGDYDALIDIQAYNTARIRPEEIPEPVACEILKIIDNPKHTEDWMALGQGEEFDDKYGEWEYYMRYSPNSENEMKAFRIEGQGKRVSLYVRNGYKDFWLDKELAFSLVLDNHPDAPYPMDESNKKLILNYDEIDVDWTKW